MKGDRSPESVAWTKLFAWRRAGLVLSSAGLACLVGYYVVTTVAEDQRPARAVLALVAIVGTLAGLGFLRRAWSAPAMKDDSQVVRARRLSDVVLITWILSMSVNFVDDFESEAAEPLDSLSILTFVLRCVLVAAFIGMLIVAARWKAPARPTDKSARP